MSVTRTDRSKSYGNKGFTLIELLVVIAIISLLAAILFPVFSRARENARKSSCANNLKQIGIGLAQYAQDYDETMPGVTLGGTGTPRWHDLLQPYMKSRQVFKCPSNSSTTTFTGSTGTWFNHYLGNGNNVGSGSTPGTGFNFRRPLDATDAAGVALTTSLADIQKPAETIAVSENQGTRNSSNLYSTSTAGGMDFTNHLSSTNFLFVDGHVKSLKPMATYRTGLNMWANDPAATDSSLFGGLRGAENSLAQ